MKDNKLLKYTGTTIINTTANVLTYFILVKLGVRIDIANIIAIIVEVPISFELKNKYVFNEDKEPKYKKFIKFILSRLFTMLIDYFGVIILAYFINKYLSKVITQIIIFFVNYFISKKIVFKNIKITK